MKSPPCCLRSCAVFCNKNRPVGEFEILEQYYLPCQNERSYCSRGCRGQGHAGRWVISATVAVWDDKMCQAAEILMVRENCVAILFFCGA